MITIAPIHPVRTEALVLMGLIHTLAFVQRVAVRFPHQV